MIEHRAATPRGCRSASTSAADVPPARPSASSAAPCAACLATAANPVEHVDRDAGHHAGKPSRQFVAHAGHAGQPSGQHHLARARRRDGERGHRLDGALDVRVPRERGRGRSPATRATRPTRRACRRSSRRRRGTAVASRRSRRETRPRRRARRPRACPAARTMPPAPSTIGPCSTARAAVNAPPSSSRMNETSRSRQPRRSRLLADGERRRAHLVRGAHVDAIHLAVRAAPTADARRRA